MTGKGGKVTVLSKRVTAMRGAITAQGGPQGGNGGFVETSGHALSIGKASINAGGWANGCSTPTT